MVRLTSPPEGFAYLPEFVTASEEQALLTDFEARTFEEVRMRGVVAKRKTLHFGLLYGYQARSIQPGPPIPSHWSFLVERIAPLLHLEPAAIREILLSRYPPGAGIGWHRDAPMFGPAVAGVSFASACHFKLRRRLGERSFEVFEQQLSPRSAYVLAGQSRSRFEHSIPEGDSLRYSLTFSTVND